MKKAFTLVELIAVIVIIGVLSIIIVPVVTNTIKSSKEQAYETQVDLILEGSRKWAIDNSEELPNENSGEVTQVNIDMIIKGGYITKTEDGKLYNPKDKSKTMDGCVEITYSTDHNQYIYNYNQNCKLFPKINEIAKAIVYQNGVCKVDGTTYQYMSGCYVKGNVSNNYVWYSGFLWRIMGINRDGTVRMIAEEGITSIPYDKAKNGILDTNYNVDFNGSYVDTWLNDYFLKHLKNTGVIMNGSFCNDINNGDYQQDCSSSALLTRKAGLVSLEEYVLSGKELSYLNNKQTFGTITKNEKNPTIFMIANDGTTETFGGLPMGVRPVINIDANASISSGNGLLVDNWDNTTGPYILGLKSSLGTLSKISTSGEYVKFGNNVYRIVSNENGKTKLVLYNINISTEELDSLCMTNYEPSNIFSLTSGIGKILNNEVLNFIAPTDELKSKILLNTWYQNDFVHDDVFTISLNETNPTRSVEAKVGFIRIGEMLSGVYDVTMNLDGEKQTSQLPYLTMNPEKGTDKLWFGAGYGFMGTREADGEPNFWWLRSIITIASNTNIVSGDGTPGNPYQL